MIPFSIIVAVDLKNGIGKNGALPWHLPTDLKHFKEITTQAHSKGKKNLVIMGRKTWESLPEKFRPLPGRINPVLTRNPHYPLPKWVLRAHDFEEVLALINERHWAKQIESVFVIGGAEVFKSALQSGLTFKVYLTQILQDFHCDTFFPDDLPSLIPLFKSAEYCENNTRFFFAEYRRL